MGDRTPGTDYTDRLTTLILESILQNKIKNCSSSTAMGDRTPGCDSSAQRDGRHKLCCTGQPQTNNFVEKILRSAI